MTDREIEHLCDLTWQEKYLELKGLKIGDEVICSFSNHHGDAKQFYHDKKCFKNIEDLIKYLLLFN